MTEYEKALNASKDFQEFRKLVEADKIRQKDLGKGAELAGQIAGEVMADLLRREYPNGQVSEENVRRIIAPILRQNHAIISDLAAKVQTAQFRKAGIGLNAVAPEYSMERETELVKEISRRSFEDGFFD